MTFAVLIFLAFFVVSSSCQSQAASTNFCCRKMNWGDSWCHNCIGEGCTTDNSVYCPDLSNCLCKTMVPTMSTAACHVERSCEKAQAYFDAARVIMKQKGYTPGDDCLTSLTRIVCAYHFPACGADDAASVYRKVCTTTCTDLATNCNSKVTLDDIAVVKGTCVVATTQDATTAALTSGSTVVLCTATASHNISISMYILSFIMAIAVTTMVLVTN